MTTIQITKLSLARVFLEPESQEPKVKVFIPMYLPLKTETCKKCNAVIADSKELIRIAK